MKLTLGTQKDMAFGTPVIGYVPWRVLDHADADGSELLRSPVRKAALAFVFCSHDLGPVGDSERNV
ncbi:MAG: hypothetical protein WC023_14825 [Rhodocyclaceae bacterium]